jgi:hypothetical protein
LNLIVYAVLALAVMGMIGTGVYKVKQWGAEEVRAEWTEANRKAEAEAAKIRQERAAEGQKSSIALQQAEKEARTYAERWKTARNALREVPLAVCSDAQPTPASAATATVASRTGGLRLTYGFLRQYDGAWTGEGGKPVFGDPAGAPEGAPAAGAASARGLDEALDTHAENARRCSENTRQLTGLIGLIERLRAGGR